jgi:hypothetical protein
VVTLDPGHPGPPVAVASVSDPESVQMRMPPPQPGAKLPRLVFENCLVRGEGDLIAAHAARPFEVELNNVFVALSGAVLSCDGSREEGAAPPDQPILLRLKQTTAYVAGYVVRLHAVRDFNGVTPVQVEAANCLFQAAGGKALMHLEGPDPGERIKTLIAWKAENNVYGGFENLLDNQPFDDKMPAAPIGPIEWPKRADESHPKILPKTAVLTYLRTDLTLAVPEDFRVRGEAQAGQGAVWGDLARPYSEKSPSSESKGTD